LHTIPKIVIGTKRDLISLQAKRPNALEDTPRMKYISTTKTFYLLFTQEKRAKEIMKQLELNPIRTHDLVELVTNVEDISKRPRMVYTKNKRKRDESIKIDATSKRVLYLSNLGPKVHVYEIKQWILSALEKQKGLY
jgi:hypothetical protein